MSDPRVTYAETVYGFTFGSAMIERLASDDKKGWVVLGLTTPRYESAIQILITKTGKVRIVSNGEWQKPEATSSRQGAMK